MLIGVTVTPVITPSSFDDRPKHSSNHLFLIFSPVEAKDASGGSAGERLAASVAAVIVTPALARIFH